MSPYHLAISESLKQIYIQHHQQPLDKSVNAKTSSHSTLMMVKHKSNLNLGLPTLHGMLHNVYYQWYYQKHFFLVTKLSFN